MVFKWNCCVPNCTNNWRNSKNIKVHTIPADEAIQKEYVRLIRNDNFRLISSSTRICGEHFVGGERVSRNQLPTIFPWSQSVTPRRKIEKHALLPKTRRKRKASGDIVTPGTEPMSMNMETRGNTETRNERINTTETGCNTEHTSNCFSTVVENDKKNELLQQEIEKLKLEVQLLKNAQEQIGAVFDIDRFKNNDKDISFYTGFPNYETMKLCFSILEPNLCNINYGKYKKCHDSDIPGRPRKLSKWQEFTIVLMRIRLGLFARDLAHRFGISESTVSTVFRAWVTFMRAELEPVCIIWPPKEQIKHYMPPLFSKIYPDLVSIIDCTEIFMECPSGLDNQSVCYSQYKPHNTVKGLIGITPSGVISFVSDLYTGSISDPDIVKKSGYLDNLNKGDWVMADKGFTIQDDLATVGARLVIPAFLQSRGQFSKVETEHNKKIACLRIHVERFMERLKNWHFFDRPIPITLHDVAPDVWIVVACFSNFLPPLIN